MPELRRNDKATCEECLVKYLGDDKYICELVKAMQCQHKARGLIGVDNASARKCLDNSTKIVDRLILTICEGRVGERTDRKNRK